MYISRFPISNHLLSHFLLVLLDLSTDVFLADFLGAEGVVFIFSSLPLAQTKRAPFPNLQTPNHLSLQAATPFLRVL